MRLISLFSAFTLLVTQAAAQCAGTDLRPSLAPDVRADIEAAVAATPFPRGNHWQATRGDRQIHLIGTYHFDHPNFAAISARLAPVVTSADRLFVEVTDEASDAFEQQIATDPSLFINQTGPTLADTLSEDLWLALRAALAERGMPAPIAAKMQPWFLSALLSLPPCAMAAMEANEGGLDAILEQTARDAGVPVSGLESPRVVMEMISGMEMDAQLALLAWSLAAQDQVEDVHASLQAMYFDEEHAFLWEFTKTLAKNDALVGDTQLLLASEAASRMLLDTRNLAWIDVIEAAPEDRLVVASGAAHLFGETGLLNQLSQRGYVLERQPF
ncbi:TraB/GumN family protein [Pseudaestuariivita atlantica]|uniref:Polysaccharide biosynthesis protein GumN n=1 Tax=Pseudaestuariivita atlantica TaxID=1317121 RepID=A0A0L1JT99_9RHOB|nr:TraB/GumN family protein [Pseudaestuariivita atlantica]KNG94981.1 hypothetical protein ATO11_06355 [Pseudaestuariivita atlantica]